MVRLQENPPPKPMCELCARAAFADGWVVAGSLRPESAPGSPSKPQGVRPSRWSAERGRASSIQEGGRENHDLARWRSLYDAVHLLSCEPDTQLQWVGSGEVKQLAVAFDEAYELIPTMHGAGSPFSAGALASLQRLRILLDELEGQTGARQWAEEALRRSYEWHEIRELARRAQQLLPPPPEPTKSPGEQPLRGPSDSSRGE
jgi:hypothetical protein